MHQFVVWTAREAEGMGADLQHYQYDQDVERKAKDMYQLPEDWSLKAQLVFGAIKEDGRPTQGKEKLSTYETIKVFGV